MGDGSDFCASGQSFAVNVARCVHVVLRGEVKPGLDQVFERLLRDFAQDVRDLERGCLSYAPTRVMGSPKHFAVHAHFASWRAFQRHALTRHMAHAAPELTALLASPVGVEIFLDV